MSRIWSHTTFTELFKQSPKKAFEYRFEALGTPIPEEFGGNTVENSVENDENANKGTVEDSSDAPTADVSENEGKEDYSAADLRAKLRDAGVKFSNAAPIDVLAQKCVENNLI